MIKHHFAVAAVIILLLWIAAIVVVKVFFLSEPQLPEQPVEVEPELESYALEVLGGNLTYQEFANHGPFEAEVTSLSAEDIAQKKAAHGNFAEIWDNVPEKELLLIYLSGDSQDLIAVVDPTADQILHIYPIIKLELGVRRFTPQDLT